ncbi:MAG: hypothetical protein ACFB2Z_00570 [Maricaulaceae bacterium]
MPASVRKPVFGAAAALARQSLARSLAAAIDRFKPGSETDRGVSDLIAVVEAAAQNANEVEAQLRAGLTETRET